MPSSSSCFLGPSQHFADFVINDYSPSIFPYVAIAKSFVFLFRFSYFVFLYCEMGWTMRQRRRRLCSIFTVKWNTCQGSNSSAIYGAQTVAARRQWRWRHLLSLSDLVNFAHLKRGTSRWPYQKGPPMLYPLSLLNTWLLHMCVFRACVCVCGTTTLSIWRGSFRLWLQFLSRFFFLSLSHSCSLSLSLPAFPLSFSWFCWPNNPKSTRLYRRNLMPLEILLALVVHRIAAACLPACLNFDFFPVNGKNISSEKFHSFNKASLSLLKFLKKIKKRGKKIRKNTKRNYQYLSAYLLHAKLLVISAASLSLALSLSHTLLQSSSFMPWKY